MLQFIEVSTLPLGQYGFKYNTTAGLFLRRLKRHLVDDPKALPLWPLAQFNPVERRAAWWSRVTG